MMKILKSLSILILTITLFTSCKKSQADSCGQGQCDPGRATVLTATDWTGTLRYYADLRKWAVNVTIPNTIDGVRTCIICTDIPDALKTTGRAVTFSGELKESCGNPKPELGGQEIYFVTPTGLR